MKTVGFLLMILLLFAGYASSQDSAVISTDAPGFATGQDNYNYVGVIKNRTNYDVSVPSRNSSATLTIPARGFIEYVSYEKDFDVTVYQDGKPFYCLKINAHPGEYAYLCKNDYDFMAEIVKPEPVAKAKYRKMKRAIKKPKPRPEGEQVG